MKQVCVVHNNVDQSSSIGKLAEWSVRTALDAGHQVLVVARHLAVELHPHVTWLPLYVPPKLHVIQWAAARRTVVRALGEHRPDVLHVYQPQVAAIADTWHLAYLSRVGVETASIQPADSPRGAVTRVQQLAVARMEDHYCRTVGARPTLLFPSDSLRRHFTRLYGVPSNQGMLVNPAFDDAVLATDRSAARGRFGIPDDCFVVGYLGGVDERKGYRSLVEAMSGAAPDWHLLMAGPGSDSFSAPSVDGRLTTAGMLSDTSDFWGAIDVLVAPSKFDPFGMVVTEAAAQGVPVVVTPDVGASDLVTRFGSGEVCEVADLRVVLEKVRSQSGSYRAGAAALTEMVEASRVGIDLLRFWSEAYERNGGRR